MRILVLSDGYRRRDDRGRMDFIKKLQRFQDVEFYLYGPREDIVDPTLAPIPFDIRLTSKDLMSLFEPDVLFFILYKTECYKWLPEDICTIAPSAILEEDHYSERYKGVEFNDPGVLTWYENMGFSLLLRRHFYHSKAPTPSVWLPFSANEKEFFPVETDKKVRQIGFAGTLDDIIYYDVRNRAVAALKDAELLAKIHGHIYKYYVEYLQMHIGALACGGGLLHTCLAKTFEIPLCGTALLTNYLEVKELLFGNKKCYFEYKDDCSDVVERAREIIEDVEQTNEVIANAVEQVQLKHTDSKRVVELYNILKALQMDKEPPRIWGQ